MLNSQTIDLLKTKIRAINKLKTVEERLEVLIQLKDDTRNSINDILDDIFASVNLKKSKINLEEE